MTYVDLWYWSVMVFLHMKCMSPLHFCLIGISRKKSQTNKWMAPQDHGQRETWLVNPFLDLSQFADPGHHEWRDSQVPLRKDLVKHLRVLLLVFLQSFPQRDPKDSYSVLLHVHWRNGNNQTFQDLMDMSSELRLILKGPKKHCGPSV